MCKIIKTLENTGLKIKEKINLAESIIRFGIYESGNYKEYLEQTNNLIQNEEYLDVYSFFLSLNSEFILNLNNKEALNEVFTNYASFFIDSFNLLSPSNDKQKYSFLEKAINTSLLFLESNLKEIYKDIDIDDNLIKEKIDELLSFFEENNIKYDDYGKSQLLKILSQINMLNRQKNEEQIISNQENDPIDQEVSENNELDSTVVDRTEKMTSTNPIITNDFGSSKWADLINKIKALGTLVDNDRVFEAAIVYEDIRDQIVDFNPIDYFPTVFTPLYKKLTPIASIVDSSIDKYSTTSQWQMAKRMCKTNLESFVNDLDRMPENDSLQSYEFYSSKNIEGNNDAFEDGDSPEGFDNSNMFGH